MSDNTDAFNKFLMQQRDILAAYGKLIDSWKNDRETLTRLMMLNAAGERVIFNGNITVPWAGNYQVMLPKNADANPGDMVSLTAIPVALRNAKKFRLIWQNWNPDAITYGGETPPYIYFALSASMTSAPANDFGLIGASDIVMTNFSYYDGSTINGSFYSFASIDVTVPVSGFSYIHLCGQGGQNLSSADFFTQSPPFIQGIPYYQLIA
jgi:hypothetical protein